MKSAESAPKRSEKLSYLGFDRASYPWKAGVNYRARPKLYRVGKGEQGVLICEPYKSELTPYWRFKTPVEARRSARKIFSLFESYLDDEDFVGADMARKFLQMGYTRAPAVMRTTRAATNTTKRTGMLSRNEAPGIP